MLSIKKHEVILTSNEGSMKFDMSYDPYLTDFEALAKDAAKDTFTARRMISTRSGETAEVISNVRKIFGTSKEEPVYLVTNVYVDKLYRAMNTFRWKHEADVSVFDEDGGLIMQSENSALPNVLEEDDLGSMMKKTSDSRIKHLDDDGNNTLVVSWKSDYNRWIYFSVFKMPTLESSIIGVRNTALFSFLFAIAAVFALLVLIFQKLYKPFLKLVKKVSIAEGIQGKKSHINFGYEYIESIIDGIIKDNEIMRDSYLESAMIGTRPLDEEEMSTQHRLVMDQYRLFVFSITKYEKSNYYLAETERLDLREGVMNFIQNAPDVADEDGIRIVMLSGLQVAALVCNWTEEKQKYIITKLERFLEKFNANHELEWTVGVSKSQTGSGSVHDAFLEAQEALKFRYFNEQKLSYYYEETIKIKRSYYEVDSVQMDILNRNMISLNIKGATTTFDYIVKDIKKKTESTYFYNIPQVFTQMFDFVANALRNNGLSAAPLYQVYEQLMPARITFVQAVQSMQAIFEWTDEYVKSQREGISKKPLVERLKEYVDNNYDKGISLSSIAFEFNLSVPYTSNLFKEKLGVSFVKYITKLKIEKAKEILVRDKQIKISEIAQILDMGNVQSFIRTFKRYEGITPGEFRNREM